MKPLPIRKPIYDMRTLIHFSVEDFLGGIHTTMYMSRLLRVNQRIIGKKLYRIFTSVNNAKYSI